MSAARVPPPPPRTDLLDDIRALLTAAGAEALLVSQPANVRYLSGFTSPEDGSVLVTRDDAILITDGRYLAQAREESPLDLEVTRETDSRVAALIGDGELAIEADHLSVAGYDALGRVLGRAPIKTEHLLRPLRMVKNDAEIAVLREAARITDRAFEHIRNQVRPGVCEIDLALELERFMVACGADGAGFGTIVASGQRSAMPHGLASRKPLAQGELITFDFGAVLHGYHADMTRTVALGDPSDSHLALWEAVAEAHRRGLAGVAPGASGKEVDSLAREALAERGLAELFAHSLGHGVGLDIHESPSLSQKSQDVLTPAMVVTVEPGVYRPGDAGVRTEDLVVVTDGGHEVLSHSPLELLTL